MSTASGAGSGSSACRSSWFEEQDHQGLLDFWRIYDAHYDDVSRWMVDTLSTDAKLSGIFDGPTVVAARAATRDLVRRGVEDGDWCPYEVQLRASAVTYARVGVTFEGWYLLTVCLADALTPHIVAAYGAEATRLVEALRVERLFLDRVRILLTTEFNRAKEHALAESEKRMRALAAKLQSAIEDERRRIAREIHDDLGQQLTALKLDHSWVLRRFETRDRSGVAQLLADMDHLLDDTVATVRRLATDLRPGVLDELGLFAALEWHARAVESRSGIRFDVTLPDDEIAVPDEQATGIFRMFQEILTNVVRHAEAKNVTVRAEVSAASILLEVQDDGRGFTAAEAERETSFGLVGMRERAKLLGGRVEIEGPPGRGTTVQVHVPLPGAPGT